MIKNQIKVDQIIDKFSGKKGVLIQMMQEIQRVEGYLSREVIRYMAEKTCTRLAHIYGVATFYTMFRLKPQGKNIIRVCQGTACHVSNGSGILAALRHDLGLKEGSDTTKNGLFTLMEVACLGCCSLAPVIMINDQTFGKLTPERISEILKKYE